MANSHGKENLMEKFIKDNNNILKGAIVKDGKYIAVPTEFNYRTERDKFLDTIFSHLLKKKNGFTLKFNDNGVSGISEAAVITVSSASTPFHIGTLKKSQSIRLQSIVTSPAVSGEARDCSKLKPNHISGVTDAWLTPEELYKKTLGGCKDCYQTSISEILQALCKGLTPLTGSHTSQLYTQVSNYPLKKGEPVPSEMFELFSAIILAKHIKESANNKNAPIRQLLYLDHLSYDPQQVYIYIPSSANFPLVDFFISLNSNGKPTGIPTPTNTKNSLRISVKSLVGSSSTNVIGFGPMFNVSGSGTTHFDAYAKTKTGINKPETLVAKAAVKNATGGNLQQYPIAAAALLSDKTFLSTLAAEGASQLSIPAKKGKNRRTKKTAIQLISSTCQILKKVVSSDKAEPRLLAAMTSNKKEDNFGDAFTDKEQNKVDILKDFIDASYLNAVGPNDPAFPPKYTFVVLSYCLERIFVAASKKKTGNLNFFSMFFAQVLRRQKVGYAVTTSRKVKDGVNIQTSFYTDKNFKNFTEWVLMRTKNSTRPRGIKQSLGLDFAK